MNAKYRQYGLLVNIFVVVSVLLASKYIFINEIIDSGLIMVTIFFIGLLYYVYKKLGSQVAQTTARFILDIYPKYLMKYGNKNKMRAKMQKDLMVLSSADNIFVLIKYNLYVATFAVVFNAIGAFFGSYSEVFTYFLVVDISILMIIIIWSGYESFRVFQPYEKRYSR